MRFRLRQSRGSQGRATEGQEDPGRFRRAKDVAAVGSPEQAQAAPTQAFGVSRIAALSDRIFAIALTLLVFSLDVPDLAEPTSADELAGALRDLWPQFGAYLQTFLILGAYWVGHHRAFRRMVREDDRLAWLNLLFLMTVSFMPFPATMLGRYPANRTAFVVFSGSLAAVSLAYVALWAYAHGSRLLAAATWRTAQIEMWTGTAVAGLFLLSIPLSFADPDLAALCGNTVLLVLVIANRAYRRMDRSS